MGPACFYSLFYRIFLQAEGQTDRWADVLSRVGGRRALESSLNEMPNCQAIDQETVSLTDTIQPETSFRDSVCVACCLVCLPSDFSDTVK